MSAFPLPLPPEPAELARAARQEALDDPAAWAARARRGEWLGEWLWAEWGEVLAPEGLGTADVAAVVAGYHLELWLWLMGERPWEHVVAGLAGRLSRRVPARRSL